MNDLILEIEKDEVLCREGDTERDLYLIISGELIILSRHNSRVTPISYLGAGDYFGEFSFFDNLPRSADVVATEKTILVKIPQSELHTEVPKWLLQLAKNMVKNIRTLDSCLKIKGIKKTSTDSIKALTTQEQTFYFNLLSK